MLQEFFELVYGLFVFVLRSEINLRDNDEEGYFKEKAKANMFFRHFLKPHVCSDDNAAKIGTEPSETVYGGLEILLVAAQIDK